MRPIVSSIPSTVRHMTLNSLIASKWPVAPSFSDAGWSGISGLSCGGSPRLVLSRSWFCFNDRCLSRHKSEIQPLGCLCLQSTGAPVPTQTRMPLKSMNLQYLVCILPIVFFYRLRFRISSTPGQLGSLQRHPTPGWRPSNSQKVWPTAIGPLALALKGCTCSRMVQHCGCN